MHTGICILRVQEGLDYADLLDAEEENNDIFTSEDYYPNSVTPMNNRTFTFDETISMKVRFEDAERNENTFRQITADNTQINMTNSKNIPEEDPNKKKAEKDIRLMRIKSKCLRTIHLYLSFLSPSSFIGLIIV